MPRPKDRPRGPRQSSREDRYACEAEFITDPSARIRYYRWSQAAYEWAIKETAFRAFAWHPSEVSPEDIAGYGEVYWRDFHDNCLVIGLAGLPEVIGGILPMAEGISGGSGNRLTRTMRARRRGPMGRQWEIL
jgi:hypothetical protein